MSEYEGDPELSGEFEGLRESVEPTVDIDGGLEDLHRTAELHPERSRIRRPAILGIAAALVAVIAIGSIALWPAGDSQVVSADGADGTSEPAADPGCENEAFVYLVPGTTNEQINSIGQVIAELDGLEGGILIGPGDTYAEFQRLFSDGPTEFLDSIDPADLPSSFKVWFGQRISAAQVARLEAIPGVYRVELPRDDCQMRAATPETTVPSETTTSTYAEATTTQPPATTAPPPVAVDRAPEISMGTMTVASPEVPAVCVDGGEGRTVAQEGLGCPPPGEQVLGTASVDGTTVLITSATTVLGCSLTGGSSEIPFEKLYLPAGDRGSRIVSVWWIAPLDAMKPTWVRAQRLSFGSCG